MIHSQFLYGADYNPEQWLKYPDILQEDIRLMKEAHVNVACMGMFSWPFLEKNDGEYDFAWFIDIIDNLYANGISVILGTPSAARPRWLAEKYPSVLRVNSKRQKSLFGERHNHCFTSIDYRKKTYDINLRLAKALSNHKGIILWHISNEFSGDCHCDACQKAFRTCIQDKYKTLDNLNDAWYMAFWGHLYTSFDQVESPSPLGDSSVNGHNLDWKRFVTHQTIDFMNNEIKAIRDAGSTLPITTNMMHYYTGQNYFKYKEHIDIVSWDSYPKWHMHSDSDMAMDHGMFHDIMRSIKQKPFLLMESTPSTTNWQPISRHKRPKMNILSSLLAIAHGSDSVQYFQWRQGRGANEKFHGAMVNHTGSANSRVFKDVTNLGKILKDLTPLCGSHTKSDIAMVYDFENLWALEDSSGPRNQGIKYKEQLQGHYKALSRHSVNIDFIDMESDISAYKMIIAPYLYMIRDGFDAKLTEFVKNGGILVAGALTGVVDENDLCYLGTIPHGLHDIFGIESEEIDALYDHQSVKASSIKGNALNFVGDYTCTELCEVVKCTSAEKIVQYTEDYYNTSPVLTSNKVHEGYAYYLTSTMPTEFYVDFYEKILQKHRIKSLIPFKLPFTVHATSRYNNDNEYLFVQNFNDTAETLALNTLIAQGYTLMHGSADDDIIGGYETLIYKKQIFSID